MRKPRVDIGQQRRAQIVEAAIGVIADAGLPALSLSAIEKRAAMSRGQLTYYFGTKEDILLAVFDHLLSQIREEAEGKLDKLEARYHARHGWERMQAFLTWFILDPPADPGFHALQHAFLSQIGHRDDFRKRLADVYEEWRRHISEDAAETLPQTPGAPAVSARTVGSLIMAILHGLRTQEAAEPGSYDRQEMLTLVLHMVGSYLHVPAANGTARPAAARNGRSTLSSRTTPKG
jgi:AcrR family transcriptional regulator